ncbi:MAG: 3-keto-5-aminohexanoate cleavage protein, partial [Thermomicrobiales bacterium]|nr:3-keto-5-aminohexanoate cleavage protein [Thermomicrobiales bacterium]
MHMKRTADQLFGDQYVWSVLGGGRHQFNLVTMGAIMGSNVRVGLEDNLYLGKGELAESNADQVAKIVRILNELSLEVATPDEARELLHTKGVHNVGF